MMAVGRWKLARWLVGPDKRPSGIARLAFFVVVLLALAGSYAATKSESVQILVLFGAVLGLQQLVWHSFGRDDPVRRQMRGRNAPLGVYLASFTVVVILGVLLFGVFRDSSLGPWSLWWLLVGPGSKSTINSPAGAFRTAARRVGARRDHSAIRLSRGWPLVSLSVAAWSLQPGLRRRVLAAALGCSAIVFLIALLFGWVADGASY